MYFQLSSLHNDKVVLQRKRPGFIYSIALITGIILLVLGVLFSLLFKPPQEEYFQGNAFFFIGILSFYSINSYLKKRKDLFPEEIIFDNHHGYIEIIQDKLLESKSYIPYEEIE
jgi:hypothetical protein